MLKYCCLLLLFFTCVRTSEHVYPNGTVEDPDADIKAKFVWWPSVLNAANLMKSKHIYNRSSKRQSVQPVQQQLMASEGEVIKPPLMSSSTTSPPAVVKSETTRTEKLNSTPATSTTVPGNTTVTKAPPVTNTTDVNVTSAIEKAKAVDFSNPGVVKRGFIVFGGFALLAIAYFIFYRTKRKSNDSGNTHSSNDANQFRYGVLQSEDRRDNLELSRVPLTMESDDDDDEDLEIFDLEQKKKSLSYVNLQTNDEDIVFNRSTEDDKQDLLLDIEDGTSQTLINWSVSGSKSIL